MKCLLPAAAWIAAALDTLSPDPGELEYDHVVASSAGMIYALAGSQSSLIRIDPYSEYAIAEPEESASSSPAFTQLLEASGSLYALPCAARHVLQLSPTSGASQDVGPDLGLLSCKWRHAAVSQGGEIYAMPWQADHVLRIQPTTSKVSLLGSLSTTPEGQYGFSVRAGGYVCGIPWAATEVTCVETMTDSLVSFGDFSGDVAKWRNAAANGDGVIFALPILAPAILRMDPRGRVAETLGSLPSGRFRWTPGPSLKDHLLGLPDSECSILLADIDHGRIETSRGFDCHGVKMHDWRSAVVAKTGHVYAVPLWATSVLKISVEGAVAQVTTFGKFQAKLAKWNHAVLAGDGNIYGVPYSVGKVLRIRPDTDEVSTFGSFEPGLAKWREGIVAVDGFIYCIPETAVTILRIDPRRGRTSQLTLHGQTGAGVTPWPMIPVETGTTTTTTVPGLAEMGLQQELKSAHGDRSLMIQDLVAETEESAEEGSFVESAASQVSAAMESFDEAVSQGMSALFGSSSSSDEAPVAPKKVMWIKPDQRGAADVVALSLVYRLAPRRSQLREDAATIVCREEPCSLSCCLRSCADFDCPEGYAQKASASSFSCASGFCGSNDLLTCCDVDLFYPNVLVPLLIFASTGFACIFAQTQRCRKERLSSQRKFSIAYFTVLFAWDVCDQTASWWFWEYTADVGASQGVQVAAMMSSMMGTGVILFAFFGGLFLTTPQLLDQRCPELSYSVAAGCADVVMLIVVFCFEMEGKDQGSWIKVLNLIATLIDFVLKVMQAAAALFGASLDSESFLLVAAESEE
eukprot:s583_g6.t2